MCVLCREQCLRQAQVAKLVDAPASGAGVARRIGSSPILGTKNFFNAFQTFPKHLSNQGVISENLFIAFH